MEQEKLLFSPHIAADLGNSREMVEKYKNKLSLFDPTQKVWVISSFSRFILVKLFPFV